MRTPEQDRALFTWQTVAEVARELCISPSHVRALIKNGALPAIDISIEPGTSRAEYRIDPEALERFMKARRVA